MTRTLAGPSRARRLLGTVLALATAGAVLAVVQFPGADGAYTAKVTNNLDTASSNPYFTCTAAVQGNLGTSRATFAYPLSDSKGSDPNDVSGNNRDGDYSNKGVTYRLNDGACTRDPDFSIALDGSKGYISGPNVVYSPPSTFSIEIWFKTTTGGGKLIGFGNKRTGSSNNNDRHLYLDDSGHVVFGVYPGAVKVIVSPNTYLNNQWHHAVATLSPSAANAPKGMALYVDGALVAADTSVTTAQTDYNGYWRIGYDNLVGWESTEPSNYFFTGRLAFAAAYNTYALSATQVAQHYAAGV